MTRTADDDIARLLTAEGAKLHGLLFRLTLRRDVADDLLQNLFLRLRASRAFGGASDHRAYAYRTAINLASKWRRDGGGRAGGTPDPEVARQWVDADPATRLIHLEECAQILDVLPRVSRAARAAFVLRFIEQREYADVAVALRTTPHGARALCQKAVQRIRQLLHDRAAVAGRRERDRPGGSGKTDSPAGANT